MRAGSGVCKDTDEFGKGQEQRRERRRVRHVALLNVPSTDNCSLYTRKILILAQGPSNLAGSGAPAFLQVQEDDQSSLPGSFVGHSPSDMLCPLAHDGLLTC